jgi:hypothetical protein
MSAPTPDEPAGIVQERAEDTGSGIEGDASRLAAVIEKYATLGLPESPVADRHAERLRFALMRLVQARSEAATGAPASRAEIALWILETHVENAAAFVNRVVRDARRRPGRRSVHAEVDEAATLMEQRLSAA